MHEFDNSCRLNANQFEGAGVVATSAGVYPWSRGRDDSITSAPPSIAHWMNALSTPATPPSAVVTQPPVASRLVELLGLFVLVPLLMRWRVVAVPRLLVLGLVTAGCLAVLWRDPTFDRARLLSWRGMRASLRTLALRGGLATVIVLALVRALHPPATLWQEPAHWLLGLALYPFLSAWPQEVLYRVFFFHRYERLLGSGRWLVAASATAFGFLHVVYPNPVAPLLSLPAGLLLALTYRRTRSMGPVWVEHTVYGLLLFTLGLGGYFFDGRP